jgi:hypothetical protein
MQKLRKGCAKAKNEFKNAANRLFFYLIKFTVSFSDSYLFKMEQKNPERTARDFVKSTLN